MMRSPPTVSMTKTHLIVAVPLENIPNMPPDAAGRALALHHLQLGIAHYAQQQQGQSGMIPGMGALGSAAKMGALL